MAALPDAATLAVYLAAAGALVLAPGPDTVYVLARGAAGGRRVGALAAAGVSTGVLLHTTAAALGLAALLRAAPTAYTVVRYLGAAYLVYLGVRTLLGRDDALDLGDDGNSSVPERSPRRAYARGVAVNVLNPKVALFFVAFLPQFAGGGSSGNATVTMLVLGALYASLTMLYLGGVGVVSGGVGSVLRGDPRFARGLRGVSGVVLVLLGLLVGLEE